MKICFVHEEYPNETNFGGIATYQKIMAEYYANHGDQVCVVTRGKKNIEYYENNVHVFRIASSNNVNSISSVKQYRRKVAKLLKILQDNNEIEIIETPDWGANTIYFEKYRKIPIVVRLHTPLKIWLNYNNNYFGISKSLMLKWENEMLNKADVITSCSELLKDMVLKQYKINKNIIVIPNPYNEIDFTSSSENKNLNLIYVGSLEERKGVLILAKALNKIMENISDNYLYVVGKDTTRNKKNISTKDYMLNIINKKYHNRIKFVGQVDNKDVSLYLNMAYVAIFPSLFDNYPYTILEAMATGKHIVCSDNIGSANLVSLNNYVFKSNDSNDLSAKVLQLFNEKRNYINYNNIKIVHKNCNQDYICKQMKKVYRRAILDYNKNNYSEVEIIDALNKVINIDNIKSIVRLEENLANIVYIISTNKGKFLVKKYNYDYNFNICNELYDIYENNNINIVRPINKKIVLLNNNKYNIFNYIDNTFGIIEDDFIIKLVNLDRKTTKKANIIEKCNKYYDYLINLVNKNDLVKQDEIFVINEYEKVKFLSLFNEQYLNHGDLSLSNIIFNNNKPYIIDFDETIITTKLYDFAVMLIKIKIGNKTLSSKEILSIIINLMTDNNYNINDYINTIKLYLCKILLEKFYLFEKHKIDLFSELQLSDNYKKYIKLLMIFSNM